MVNRTDLRLSAGYVGLGYDKNVDLYISLDGSHSEYPSIEVFVQRPEAEDQSEQLVKGHNPQDLKRGLFPIHLTDQIEGSKKLKP